MPRGQVKAFKKDQGFGTLLVDGAEVPFDYDACADFGAPPQAGDVVEVTVGLSRLKRPKATFVKWLSSGPPPADAPAADPLDLEAKKIEGDLAPHREKGRFKDVQGRWIAEAGLGSADRLYAVARFYVRGAPNASAKARDLAALAGAIASLGAPENRAEVFGPSSGRLAFRLPGKKAVRASVSTAGGVIRLFNTALARANDGERIVALKAGDDLYCARLDPALLVSSDEERVLPVLYAELEPA